MWSGGLSVQGFPQREYDQLLDVSSTYVQEVQATALATVRALIEDDTEIGRRAAIAVAAIEVWLAGYSVGLVDGRPDREQPQFTEG